MITATSSSPAAAEYLPIDPEQQQAELFRKRGDGLRVLRDLNPGRAPGLASVHVAIPWERLFRNAD